MTDPEAAEELFVAISRWHSARADIANHAIALLERGMLSLDEVDGIMESLGMERVDEAHEYGLTLH